MNIAKTLAEFVTKDVGTNKTVNVTGITISGTDAGNYTLTSSTAAGTASITAVSLTITATASDKVYDANKTANVSLSSNKLGSDVVNIAKTLAEFVTKDVGTNKTVNVTGITISGTDAGNYTLTSITAITNADITSKGLTVNATANNKLYDGNTTAVVATLISNKLGSDIITIANTTATFADKNVGTAKVVTVSGISISGTDASNYALTSVTSTTNADITAKSLIITAVDKTKIYGALNPILTVAYTGLVNGDAGPTATISTTALASSIVGIYPITVTGAVDANYAISYVAGTLTVTKAALTITAEDKSKLYGAAMPALTYA